MRHTVTSELDPELFGELERERRAAGLSRSAAMRQGVEWWVAWRKEHGEERVGRLEKRHRQVMRRLEYLIGMIREQERLQGVSSEELADGSGGLPAESPAPESNDAGSAERFGRYAGSGESPLLEARKRARRRVE